MSRLITSIARLDEITGGFGLGEVWAIAGPPNTFRTGLAYNIAKDIVMLNKAPLQAGASRLMLAKSSGSDSEILNTMRMVSVGHFRPSTLPVNKEIFKGGKPNSKGWVVQTRTQNLILSAEDLLKEILEVEAHTGERVQVVVFSEFQQWRTTGGHEPIDLIKDINKLCREYNILAIIPVMPLLKGDNFKKDWTDGIIYTSIVDDDRTKLTLKVRNKRTGNGGAFDLTMKKAPEFGYESDPQVPVCKIESAPSKPNYQEIVINDKITIFIMGDGSIFKSEDSELDYTTVLRSTKLSAGGVVISKYRADAHIWEYFDRCLDLRLLKEYMATMAYHRSTPK